MKPNSLLLNFRSVTAGDSVSSQTNVRVVTGQEFRINPVRSHFFLPVCVTEQFDEAAVSPESGGGRFVFHCDSPSSM